MKPFDVQTIRIAFEALCVHSFILSSPTCTLSYQFAGHHKNLPFQWVKLYAIRYYILDTVFVSVCVCQSSIHLICNVCYDVRIDPLTYLFNFNLAFGQAYQIVLYYFVSSLSFWSLPLSFESAYYVRWKLSYAVYVRIYARFDISNCTLRVSNICNKFEHRNKNTRSLRGFIRLPIRPQNIGLNEKINWMSAKHMRVYVCVNVINCLSLWSMTRWLSTQ